MCVASDVPFNFRWMLTTPLVSNLSLALQIGKQRLKRSSDLPSTVDFSSTRWLNFRICEVVWGEFVLPWKTTCCPGHTLSSSKVVENRQQFSVFLVYGYANDPVWWGTDAPSSRKASSAPFAQSWNIPWVQINVCCFAPLNPFQQLPSSLT